ncbi:MULTISPECIES: polysaccharide deacetylase family protein [Streptomyces]|uniref:hypothetical protein n=1 Tax=Streptomyces TaxID=1883 RepID=UPI00163C7476|nr:MULTISPECIES: hypothetical protein [Streptomyces]MBC2875821.1 hypothetical protein [Streptomyces sp. TYQ1024]UBI37672.1 hypothetical protein K7I03_15120 [Streptomyces mobaraensis]UKW30259.1 hypothetical protein MCU78_15080 [Streptomyces sp. TYQ1024]
MAAAWRYTLGALAALSLATGTAACSGTGPPEPSGPQAAPGPNTVERPVRLLGDGSTADTGPQPRQPKPRRMASGEKPPQFVVFSWDGAGEDSQRLFSHFRKVGKKYHATMTYFLSGVYMLPEDKRTLYEPPQHAAGASDIGFNDVRGVRDTVEQLRGAWLDGSEIGTHFNGHFCGQDRGVGTWSPAEWKSEIRQALSFVRNWKTNAGLKNEPPLPFDYAKELVGGRAPCLEGQHNLIKAARSLGFRYDASSAGGRQVWPSKIGGLWDFPLQDVPVPGRGFETLSMDYNFLANQSGTTKGDPSRREAWGRQMRDGLLAGFERAYHGNRAPLFIGDHFESWNGGIYMKAVESVMARICTKEGVRCVSFKQLADWLDAQDPEVLAKLRRLEVGEAPRGGWAHLGDARSSAPHQPTPHLPSWHAPSSQEPSTHEPYESSQGDDEEDDDKPMRIRPVLVRPAAE